MQTEEWRNQSYSQSLMCHSFTTWVATINTNTTPRLSITNTTISVSVYRMMAKASLLSLSLTLLILFHSGLAMSSQQPKQQQNECQIDKLDSLEPSSRVKYEAGLVETWDPSHKQFRCAGVAMIRRTIQPNGLALATFSNAPQLYYVLQGEGLTGILIPGCAETFQAPQGSQSQSRFQDQHQKIRRFRKGDIIAMPAGVAHWCYNEGNLPVVIVGLFDVSNGANQLDVNPRQFHLAGNPREEFQTERQRREQQQQESYRGGSDECSNLFCGFEPRLLAEAFNVDERLIRKLRNANGSRGAIVKVQGDLQVARPPKMQKEQGYEELYRGERVNGLEETFCTLKLTENIGDPSKADIYTRGAGHITTLNSFNLPVLRALQLSAERGLLHKNAMMVPHWNLNAHSIIYAIRGSALIQVTDNYGLSVFDGELRQGQVLTVPQHFTVLKRSRGDEFEWIAFKTDANAMISPLSGRTSVIRGIPEEVLANAFQISLEDARRLKYNNQQSTLIPCSQSSREVRDVA